MNTGPNPASLLFLEEAGYLDIEDKTISVWIGGWPQPVLLGLFQKKTLHKKRQI